MYQVGDWVEIAGCTKAHCVREMEPPRDGLFHWAYAHCGVLFDVTYPEDSQAAPPEAQRCKKCLKILARKEQHE